MRPRRPIPLPSPFSSRIATLDSTRWSDEQAIATSERVQVVVIGGGQAGLSVGYCLAQRGLSFVILDANARDRRRLAQAMGLAASVHAGQVRRAASGCRFPRRPSAFRPRTRWRTTSNRYAKHFNLPVRTGVKVDRVWRDGARYLVEAGDRRFEADHVVVAMATYQKPRVPEFATGARSGDRAAALQRIPEPGAAAAGRRAPRGRRQFRRGHRDRRRADRTAPGCRAASRPRAVPHRQPRCARDRAACSFA